MSDEDEKQNDLSEEISTKKAAPKERKEGGAENELVKLEYDEDTEESRQGGSYGAGGKEDLVKKLQKLKLELKSCRKEKAEYLAGWQKERADFANYRRDEGEGRRRSAQTAREEVLSAFLPVLDSFHLAFANREAWNRVDESWRRGVEYIHNQMLSVLENYGVLEFGREGEDFEPVLHHSSDSVFTENKEDDHKIAEVIQKGYKLGEQVLRPARVKIFEYRTLE